MAQQTHSESVGQAVRATLAARRDLGPGYDDYFVESLVRNLTQHLAPHADGPGAQALDRRVRPTRDPRMASSRQRLFLAVVSLVALVIVAGLLTASAWGLLGFIVAGGAIGLINVLFARA